MSEFFMTYGAEIIGATGLIFGLIIAWLLKKGIEKNATIKTITELAKQVVMAVEQSWPNLSGEDKLQEALTMLEKLLLQYKINLPVEQMTIFIEAALGGFNKVFDKE